MEPAEFTPAERKEYLKSIEARPTDEHTQFIWDSLREEVNKGVADSHTSANELDKRFGKGKWVPTNCFCLG